MTRGDAPRQSPATAFDDHYRAGWAILKRVALVGTNRQPQDSARRDAEQAVAHFRECLSLQPTSWACMWAIGKAKQAMGDHREALTWFERAAAIESENADIWREAAIAAGALGDATKAVQHAMAALKLKPDDAGLHANAALGFLLAGDDSEAERMPHRACELAPDDTVNRAVAEIVRSVRTGARKRPQSL
jgi:Flp pilus assembly protein TadD